LRALEAQLAHREEAFDAEQSNIVGKTIAHYRIIGTLGTGGMGTCMRRKTLSRRDGWRSMRNPGPR
jgi:hypothetical protein